MPSQIKDIQTVDETSYPYIFEKNVSVPVPGAPHLGPIRCNVYRPHDQPPHPPPADPVKYPVIATYGPYGKDVPYSVFNAHSFAEVNPSHKSPHSSWETPDPAYWTARGYVVVRADELGLGQSPGRLDVLGHATATGYHALVEWAAAQPWSSGRVGLLGISYFGATQWAVAARRPRGLAAIVPWEGFSDLYRDAARHGGILANGGMQAIWKRQIEPNQYGLPGRAARGWGDDTIEGDLGQDELAAQRVAFADSFGGGSKSPKFRDSERFASAAFNLEDVQVPVLSVANLGGLLLHLRGNVQGYMHAGSEHKFLRFIVGRHDLPFYYDEEVKVQESFLAAFLKGIDKDGWKTGGIPPVNLILRKGDVGVNDPVSERQFSRRAEQEWPLARTQYRALHLVSDGSLSWCAESQATIPTKVGWQAFGDQQHESTTFKSVPFQAETEITGHIVVSLNVSVSAVHPEIDSLPTDMDLFLSLRHLSGTADKEIGYTGSLGTAVPITKGFLRLSLRKTNPQHPRHRAYLPHRDYYSTDVLPVVPNDVYAVDIEMWPTNVVVQAGERLALEIGAHDQAGTEIFTHNDPLDRPSSVFKGANFIHFSPAYRNLVTLPIIPALHDSQSA